jgi:uncharacterized protein (TIGR02265 family)
MPQVKGTAVQSSLRYVQERFGQETLARVIDRLDPPDREVFHHGILPSSWYPMSAFLHFMQEARRQLGSQDKELLRHMGVASCDYGMSTVYRIFFKLGSPEFVIGRASGVFSSYYDTGRVRIVDSGPGRAIVELEDFDGAGPEFCERLHGWMERILELAGARNVRSAHSSCVHRGDAVCRFEGRWE